MAVLKSNVDNIGAFCTVLNLTRIVEQQFCNAIKKIGHHKVITDERIHIIQSIKRKTVYHLYTVFALETDRKKINVTY